MSFFLGSANSNRFFLVFLVLPGRKSVIFPVSWQEIQIPGNVPLYHPLRTYTRFFLQANRLLTLLVLPYSNQPTPLPFNFLGSCKKKTCVLVLDRATYLLLKITSKKFDQLYLKRNGFFLYRKYFEFQSNMICALVLH